MGTSSSSKRRSSVSPAAGSKANEGRHGARIRDFEDVYVLGHRLSVSGFSEVYEVIRHDSPHEAASSKLAVKVIDVRKYAKFSAEDGCGSASTPMTHRLTHESNTDEIDPRKEVDAQREIQIWRRLSRRSEIPVVRLHDVFWDDARCYLLMDGTDMSLLEALETSQDLNQSFLCKLFSEMLSAIAGLHSEHIVHGDVKPQNVFVDRSGNVKLGNFGCSAVLSKGKLRSGIVGTLHFMAPEMLLGQRYGEKIDVWAVGVLMYVLTYGEFPHKAVHNTTAAVKAAIVTGEDGPTYALALSTRDAGSELPSVSPDLENAIRMMLRRHPSERPSSARLLKEQAGDIALARLARVKDASVPEGLVDSFRPMLNGAICAGAFGGPDSVLDNKLVHGLEDEVGSASHASSCWRQDPERLRVSTMRKTLSTLGSTMSTLTPCSACPNLPSTPVATGNTERFATPH
mmetsp:Transcript_43735/g.103299  ORF Transcript_43735/g.103299 Transcript_43735/m.103299 type:complete len:457 (+) Transcript_43735:53-1423(+)